MKKIHMLGLALASAAALLCGCTPVQSLDTPQQRADAVREQAGLVAEAVAALDVAAVERMQCEDPRAILMPRSEDLPPSATLPLSVTVARIEELDLSHSPAVDPDADYHLVSLRGTGLGEEYGVLPEAIVRVDESEVCVWGLDSPLVVFLGL